MGWVGLGWVGLGWVGLGWVGLSWVGLGWVGLGWGGCAWLAKVPSVRSHEHTLPNPHAGGAYPQHLP